MTYRIAQLAVGNYFVEYSAPAHGRTDLTETLFRVEDRITVDDEEQHFILKVFGATKSVYGGAPSFSSKSIDTENDKVKFAPLSQDEALLWIERNDMVKSIDSALKQAKENLAKAELLVININALGGSVQPAISGEAANA